MDRNDLIIADIGYEWFIGFYQIIHVHDWRTLIKELLPKISCESLVVLDSQISPKRHLLIFDCIKN